MPTGAVYELAILLSLKDFASGGLDRLEDRLRATGKEGRALLKTVQDLRKDLRQGLAEAGIGVGTLVTLKKGVGVAGDYESAVTDLRLSIEELGTGGTVNLQALGNQMDRLEQKAMSLGNALPGSTQDFLQTFEALKHGGLETKTILDGAGEAASHLAVVMKEKPQDLAEPYAQFGKQFQLKPEEYPKSADLFSRIYRMSGLRAPELIEGSKFFQLRAGAPLGLKGLEGAETGARLMAALRSYGLEGGIAGREAAMFFSHMVTHKDALSDLKKATGIDMQLFGKKGEFLGFDNVFKQMEKLRSLSTEKQMQAFKTLGGEEGAGVGNIFMQMGEKGWKEQYERLSKIPSLQSQINEVTATYNAKWEAVQGTMSNITATVFTPMLDILKPILDFTNGVLGEFQEWAKTHPEIAKLVTTTAGLIGILLTITGGIRAATAAWGLYRIASAAALGGAEEKAGGLARRLTSIPTMLKIGLILGAAWYTLENILTSMQAERERIEGEKNLNLAGRNSTIAIAEAERRGQATPQDYLTTARGVKTGLNADQQLEYYLAPERESSWHKLVSQGTNPFRDVPSDLNNKLLTDPSFLNRVGAMPGDYHSNLLRQMEMESAAAHLQNRAPELVNPRVMAEFRSMIPKGGYAITEERMKNFSAELEKAFPASFKQSEALIALKMTGMAKIFDSLISPMKQTGTEFNDVNASARPLPGAFNQSTNAARNFARDIANLKLVVPGFSLLQGEVSGSKDGTASPSTTKTSALRSAIEDNRAGGALRAAIASSSSGGGVRDVHININVPEGSPATKDPEALAAFIQSKVKDSFADHLWNNAREVERIAVQQLGNGSERA
jgi:TP901 family phage tail tape measure protein